MVVTFAAGAVSCRVTRTELERLLSGRAITLDVVLPREHRFRMNIRPASINGWQLESDPTGLWLSIPRTDLEAFQKETGTGMQRTLETSGGGSIDVRVDVEPG